MSVVSKLQFTHASRSSHSWLSKQPQLVQSSKLVVASLSCAELGTAQPQLVIFIFKNTSSFLFFYAYIPLHLHTCMLLQLHTCMVACSPSCIIAYLYTWKLTYRVSRNIVPTFVFLISRPPEHLEISSWTFFNSPFHVDFKTIQFVIIR